MESKPGMMQHKRAFHSIGLVLLTVSICVMLMLTPVYAQQANEFIFYDLFCAASLIAAETGSMCAQFAACVADYEQGCFETLYSDMLSLCEAPVCSVDVLFNLALVMVAGDHYLERSDTRTFTLELTKNLQRHAQGGEEKYQEVGDSLMQLYDEYGHRYLPYAAALAYEGAGNTEQALESYKLAEETQFFTPLVYYSRANLYLQMGELDRANRDFHTFAGLSAGEPHLSALTIPEGMTEYTLPETETWTLFPLASFDVSPGGNFDTILFSAPARDLEMAWLDDGNTLAVRNFYNGGTVWSWSVPEVLFFDCDAGSCDRSLGFQQTFWGLAVGGTFLNFTFNDDFNSVIENSFGSESGTQRIWVTLPSPADDPRPTVPCENGTYPRLHDGDLANVQLDWDYFTVYAEPDTESEVLSARGMSVQLGIIDITGEVTCGDDGTNWYPVSLPDGTSGWVQEADPTRGYYQIQPPDSTLWTPLNIPELLALPSVE